MRMRMLLCRGAVGARLPHLPPWLACRGRRVGDGHEEGAERIEGEGGGGRYEGLVRTRGLPLPVSV